MREAHTLLEESLAIQRQLADRQSTAELLAELGRLALRELDSASARALFEESLAICKERGDRQGIAGSLHEMGEIAARHGDFEAAWGLYGEALALNREIGYRAGQVDNLEKMGELAHARGDYRSARLLYEEGLTIQGESGDSSNILPLYHLGILAFDQCDYESARSIFEQVLAIDRRRMKQGGAVLIYLGRLSAIQGDYEAARAWCDQCLAQHRVLESKKNVVISAMALSGLGDLAHLRGDHGAARVRYSQALDLLREMGHPGDIAACLERLAAIFSAQGQTERAARLLGAVERLREAPSALLSPNEQAEFNRQVATTRAALAEGVFAAAWAKGRAMTWEEAVADALGEPESCPVF
jgi:tetratricopeptide (TPR) repeat protein